MIITSTKKLYEQDFYLWLETTTQLLREGKLAEIDLENLIEEIESIGRSEKRAIESNLIVVLMHLLKWQYQPRMRSNSWKSSIREHRRRLNKDLKDSPSLKAYLLTVFSECYQEARFQAADETGLPLDIFSEISIFTQEEALNPNYLPDETPSGV